MRKGLRTFILMFMSFFVAYTAAAETRIRLSGEEHITLNLSSAENDNPVFERYCVWLEQAEQLEREWSVKLQMPDGGMVLKPSGHGSTDVPFEFQVQQQTGGPISEVRPESLVAEGSALTSHCRNETGAFLIRVLPTKSFELIPGGTYRQNLKLKLNVQGLDPVLTEIPVTLRVAHQVAASLSHSELTLPRFDGQQSPVAVADLCLFRNGGGQYVVRLQGEGEGSSFALKRSRGNNETLPYNVHWRSGGQIGESLQPGQASRLYSGSSFRDCRGGSNASLQITVPAEEAQKAMSGHYQDSLRITVQAR
ncbi:hypothetical protein [Parendozoicomonas haliclonae]|uniref:Spore coat protein U domain-containing protein n=1 Tax=Parendozoicomonas haliclonae TaxID=1960125 RepID=A0A1X7AGQ0_9GAMM|nr:hypothetical protein [Parendozoicomonas haliclonae]SMA39324.1 hypothetical protein EHSB41UT_01011 [Parendozoicomonas haliclonae]